MTGALALGDRQLTPHFRLSEFAVSAAHPDLVVPVPRDYIGSAVLLAEQLEVIRSALGRPMQILSGYRSKALNKAVGGSPTSQHTLMQAADFTCTLIRDAFETVLDLVKAGKLPHCGQIIYYPDQAFVHVALISTRFPRATPCVHWPAGGMKYRPIGANRQTFAQLVPVVAPTDTAVGGD